LRIPCRKDQ